MKPSETYTISQFINSNSTDEISYDSLCFIDKVNKNTTILSYNVLNDYLSEINDLVVTVEFDDKEHIKYRYKPKLLSHDVYGDSELYYIILYINNIYSVKDFDFKKVRLLRKETLEFILSSIYNAERSNLDNYNDKEI